MTKDFMGNKAPEMDGFTMGFFKKCWNIICFVFSMLLPGD